MRAILGYCDGAIRREVSKGAVLIKEGGKTGHLFVLIAGQLEVLRGDAVVAVLSDSGAVTGEMSMLLDRPHTATVRAGTDSTVFEIEDAAAFLKAQPAVALLIAQLLAQRLNVATTYLADLMSNMPGTAPIWRWSARCCRA